MNVRWYGHNAVAATKAMCDRLGLGEPRLLSTYTRHHHEQLEGSELEVRSALTGGGNKLRIYHELRNRADEDLAATFVHEIDHAPVEAPVIELPDYGRPRSLTLDVDGLAQAPPLSEVRELDLSIRFEREVTTEDTMNAEVVPSWLANNLIWGGERPDDEDEKDWIHTLPSGDRAAFVVMEQQLWIGQLPALGTRIQSFGATVAIGDKISHGVSWCYDLDTEQPLTVLENINLAFNLTQRRSMVITPEMRTERAARLHPNFAL